MPSLYFDCGNYPEGHTARSRGFKAKILDNPHMNRDHRNLGLVGYCDGVPFFDDQRRGAWPFMFKVANLPDGLSSKMVNCHLGLISANEYLELDEVHTLTVCLHPVYSLHIFLFCCYTCTGGRDSAAPYPRAQEPKAPPCGHCG